MITCTICGKQGFKNMTGLSSHQRLSKDCKKKRLTTIPNKSEINSNFVKPPRKMLAVRANNFSDLSSKRSFITKKLGAKNQCSPTTKVIFQPRVLVNKS
jgi:hypothetical protein